VSVGISSGALSTSEPGQLVRVRGRHWVVADVSASALPASRAAGGDPERLVTLNSVEDDRYDETIPVPWGLERGAQVLARHPPVRTQRQGVASEDGAKERITW